jgi:hypothetical protein
MDITDNTLKHMARDTNPLAMVGEEILKFHFGEIDVVLGTEFYLPHCPVPYGGQMIKKLFALLFLRLAHSQLELVLNHVSSFLV